MRNVTDDTSSVKKAEPFTPSERHFIASAMLAAPMVSALRKARGEDDGLSIEEWCQSIDPMVPGLPETSDVPMVLFELRAFNEWWENQTSSGGTSSPS